MHRNRFLSRMPITREDLKKTRENSLNSSAVLYSRPREVRIDYAPVKKERDTRRDSRTSHISHASSMLQGYGCRCPPALKHFIKYTWILVLLIYLFIMPYLISDLYLKVGAGDKKLAALEKIVDSLKTKAAAPRKSQSSPPQKRDEKPTDISDPKAQYRAITTLRSELNAVKLRYVLLLWIYFFLL